MTNETLSDKIFYENTDDGFVMYVRNKGDMSSQIVTEGIGFIEVKDVKEAVKKLKEVIHGDKFSAQIWSKGFHLEMDELIKEIFGRELTK